MSGIVINYDDSDAFKYAPFVGVYSPDIETFVRPNPSKRRPTLIKKYPVLQTYRDVCDDMDLDEWPQLKAKLDAENIQTILAAAITYTGWCSVVRRVEGDLDSVYDDFGEDAHVEAKKIKNLICKKSITRDAARLALTLLLEA
jgi:hypothetical protein